MELYAVTPGLELLDIVENLQSLRWQRDYNTFGTFELRCSPKNLDLLSIGNYLWIKGGKDAAVIQTRQRAIGEDGHETLVVAGKMLSAIFAKRIIAGSVQVAGGTYEALMRSMVDGNAIQTTADRGAIQGLSLATQAGYTNLLLEEYQNSYGDLSKELEKLSLVSGLGHRVTLDPYQQEMRFEVYAGIDRSTAQSERSPCIFSAEYENLLSCQYSESDLQYRNVVYVEGEENATTGRTVVVVGNATGNDRRELYTHASGLKRTVTVNGVKKTLTEAQYLATLRQYGAGVLASTLPVEAFDAKIKADANLRYQEDYDVGDIVTVRAMGLEKHLRITQCEEVYEKGKDRQVYVLFGDPPVLRDK